MQPIATDVWHCVCVSLCVSVTGMYPAKMAGPVEMPFGMWHGVGPGNHILDGGPDSLGMGQFWDGEGVVP